MVKAFCTAEEYNFDTLSKYLENKFLTPASYCQDVLHISIPQTTSEVFYFRSGSFVAWDTDHSTDSNLIEELKPFQIRPIEKIEREELSFKIGNAPGVHGETLTITEDGTKERLAFSNSLSNSVKLGQFESTLEQQIEKLKEIPQLLINSEKIPFSRKQILQTLGLLMHLRSLINLRSELLETPDLYWSHPVLEDLYTRSSHVLELRQRVRVLNQKLDYANELVEVLRRNESEMHGLKLEWGIIALIAVEVAFEFVHYFQPK